MVNGEWWKKGTDLRSVSLFHSLFQKSVFTLLLFLFSAFAANAQEAAFRIIHPSEDALVSEELNHLVARISDSRVSYVVVRVNDQITPVIDMTSESYREVLGNMLIVRIYLMPGENEVEVTVKDSDGKDVESRKMKIFYRDPFGSETSAVPDTYSRYPMHVAEKEEECVGCHRMEVDAVVDIDPAKKYDLFCVSCHEAGMADKKMHGTATWKCLQCHSHEGEIRYGLRDEKGLFCLDCHKDRLSAFLAMTSVHAVVRGEECLGCHRNHNSVADGLTSKPVLMLCFDCHEKIYEGTHITPGHPLEAVNDPSREGKGFDCVSCHDPHASKFAALLKYKPGMTMCQVCHAK